MNPSKNLKCLTQILNPEEDFNILGMFRELYDRACLVELFRVPSEMEIERKESVISGNIE